MNEFSQAAYDTLSRRYQELRNLIDDGSELMTHQDALEELERMDARSSNAEPYVAFNFELLNGRTIQATLESDDDQVTIRLVGPKCGELSVVPSAGNAIRLRATGRGVEPREVDDAEA